MPMSEAKRKANKKWNDAHLKERYDRIQVLVQKGQKDVIKSSALARGETVNEYIRRAIALRMSEGGTPAK